MLKNLLAILLFCVSVLLSLEAATAQPSGGREPQYGNHIYSEVVQLPSDSAGYTRMDVFLRIAYDFMIFSRSGKEHADSLFGAGFDASLDVRRDEITVQSYNHFAEVYAADYEATSLRDRYLLIRQTYYLPADSYEVLITLSDNGSERTRIVRHELETVDLSSESRSIGRPVSLMGHESQHHRTYSIYGYGGTLPFAENTLLGIPVPVGWEGDWTVRLSPLDEDGDLDGDVAFESNIQPTDVITNVRPTCTSGIVSDFDLKNGASTEGKLVLLTLPIAQQDVGRYRLTVISRGEQKSDSVSFDTRVYWRSMPYSLRDIQFAVRAMRYILTAIEYDLMRKGSDREMTRRFRRYWRENDPTPDTEYNERMAEYFRRVDKTVDKFQTLYERNGSMTDRGKIYILFGPPEDRKRVLNSDDPAEEIWYYPSLSKEFRFIDRNRNGDLKLYDE